jgi:hypothetical protein
MCSSLRNIGNSAEAARLLVAELENEKDDLDGAVRAFLALALSDLDQNRLALHHALTALSGYLPRYNQSLHRYASDLKLPGTASTNAP